MAKAGGHKPPSQSLGMSSTATDTTPSHGEMLLHAAGVPEQELSWHQQQRGKREEHTPPWKTPLPTVEPVLRDKLYWQREAIHAKQTHKPLCGKSLSLCGGNYQPEGVLMQEGGLEQVTRGALAVLGQSRVLGTHCTKTD